MTKRTDDLERLWHDDLHLETVAPRLLLIAVAVVVVATLVIAARVNTDVVVEGAAVMTPRSEVARVESPRDAIVQTIAVHNGEIVQANQPLVILDSSEDELQEALAVAEINHLQESVKRLGFVVDQQRRVAKLQEDNAKTDRKILSAALDAATRELDAARAALERETRQRDSMQNLAESGIASEAALDQSETSIETADARVAIAEARVDQTLAALERATNDVVRVGQEVGVAVMNERLRRDEALQRLTALHNTLRQVRMRRSQAIIRAPRSGIVTALTVRDRGDVVTVGEVIGYVVPRADAMTVDIRVPPSGIGFVREGQPVRLRLDSYPFQDFGTGSAVVIRVSPDALNRDGQQRSYYRVEAELRSVPRAPNGTPVDIRAGMTAQAEFIVLRQPLLRSLLRPTRTIGASLKRSIVGVDNSNSTSSVAR